MFTERTKTLLCILMRDDSKQLSLFSCRCGELLNIMLLLEYYVTFTDFVSCVLELFSSYVLKG